MDSLIDDLAIAGAISTCPPGGTIIVQADEHISGEQIERLRNRFRDEWKRAGVTILVLSPSFQTVPEAAREELEGTILDLRHTTSVHESVALLRQRFLIIPRGEVG